MQSEVRRLRDRLLIDGVPYKDVTPWWRKRRWWGMSSCTEDLKPTHDPPPWPKTFGSWVNAVFDVISPFVWMIWLAALFSLFVSLAGVAVSDSPHFAKKAHTYWTIVTLGAD